MGLRLFHFSESSSIERFTPHVPPTNPTETSQVWAIDEAHQSLYWFPRDCPRVAVWTRTVADRPRFQEVFCTMADRVHAMEAAWLHRMQQCELFRYELPSAAFRPWVKASGQWVADVAVEPLAVEPVGDLFSLHAEAGVELRLVPSLWPMADLAQSDEWDFSIVRLANAAPRAD